MLKKVNRLSSFRIKGKSKILDTSLFKAKIFSAGKDEKKFGFVVSKKIDKRAVVRNETKRVLKNAVRQVLDKTKTGNNIIILAKTKLSFNKKEIVEKEMEEVFGKANILNEPSLTGVLKE